MEVSARILGRPLGQSEHEYRQDIQPQTTTVPFLLLPHMNTDREYREYEKRHSVHLEVTKNRIMHGV
jgi:hypothetical protein